MTSQTGKRAFGSEDSTCSLDPHEITLPMLQCTGAVQAIEQLPALQTFRSIACANVVEAGAGAGTAQQRRAIACDTDTEALRFFDTALDMRQNTLNVVVGGRKSGKMTKLRALVHMTGGCARFLTGDLFRDELLEQADISLCSKKRSIVVLTGRSGALPPLYEDDGGFSLQFDSHSGQREIYFSGNSANVALAVDNEDDVAKLARLGLRLNVLRLGDKEYHAPLAAFTEADNAAVYETYSAGEHRVSYLSHAEMLPLLTAGGAAFAAWRALVRSEQTLHDIQRRLWMGRRRI